MFCTVSVTAKVVPGARSGAGGFVVSDVSTRSGRGPTTWTVFVVVTSPPLSDHARTLNVFGPGVSARKNQVATRGRDALTLPRVNASGTPRKLMVVPSHRVVRTSSSVTPRGISVGSTWTPDATYDGAETVTSTANVEPTCGFSVLVMNAASGGVGSPRITVAAMP